MTNATANQTVSIEEIQKAQAEINIGVVDIELTVGNTMLVKKLNRFGSLGRAGIVEGDQIVALNGVVPGSFEVAWAILANAGVGSVVTYRVRRMGTDFDLPVTLLRKKTLSFDLEDVNQELDRRIAP